MQRNYDCYTLTYFQNKTKVRYTWIESLVLITLLVSSFGGFAVPLDLRCVVIVVFSKKYLAIIDWLIDWLIDWFKVGDRNGNHYDINWRKKINNMGDSFTIKITWAIPLLLK